MRDTCRRSALQETNNYRKINHGSAIKVKRTKRVSRKL